MPCAKFVRKSEIGTSFRVEKVKGNFDLAELSEVQKDFDVNIPIEDKKWNIGLIVGSSGSGKTTIASECFPNFLFFNGFDWNAKSMIEDFPKKYSVDEIVTACNYVGLSSAPDWLKPFSVLSNGQKMRAEIARLFLEEAERPVIYDEFTSVVDRQVAQVSSHAISKYIRRNNKQFVAVSCHRDIIDWLCPDWVFDTDKNEFQWRSLRRRPEIKLNIRQGKQAEWRLFRDYHYLNSNHNTSAQKYIAEINGVPVAWCSVLPAPGRIKKYYRVHRLVVRPDYQGLGIGTRLLSYVCARYKKQGKRISIITSLAFLSKVLSNNDNFICTNKGYSHGNDKGAFSSFNNTRATSRLTATFEYIGERK